jgi:hypothetical protein
MDQKELALLVDAVIKRQDELIYYSLFKEQREVVDDKSTTVACLTTRRAGKSWLEGSLAILKAKKYHNSLVPYIALTRQSAKNILWPILTELKNKFLIDAELRESDLTMKLANGSELFLVGADQKNFIERLRGPKYPAAFIDEAQSFREHIQSLIDDVLLPAVADYNGQVYIFGTPGPIPLGLFYDATVKKIGWSVHQWSVLSNPYMPDIKSFIANLKARRGWTDENPTYRREWLGEWVEDLDALVYRFKREKNEYSDMPAGSDWFNILGVDYGWNDATAFSIVSYSDSNPNVYIRHAEAKSEMIPSRIAERIKQLIGEYNPVKIVADTGGLGKSITEEMRQRYQLPIMPAQKTEKLTNISLMNGDFIDCRLFIRSGLKDLINQYLTLTKDENGLEDPAMPNDLCDAALYAYREARGYSARIPDPKLKAGSKEYYEKIELELEKRLEDDLMRESTIDWLERA